MAIIHCNLLYLLDISSRSFHLYSCVVIYWTLVSNFYCYKHCRNKHHGSIFLGFPCKCIWHKFLDLEFWRYSYKALPIYTHTNSCIKKFLLPLPLILHWYHQSFKFKVINLMKNIFLLFQFELFVPAENGIITYLCLLLFVFIL